HSAVSSLAARRGSTKAPPLNRHRRSNRSAAAAQGDEGGRRCAERSAKQRGLTPGRKFVGQGRDFSPLPRESWKRHAILVSMQPIRFSPLLQALVPFVALMLLGSGCSSDEGAGANTGGGAANPGAG